MLHGQGSLQSTGQLTDFAIQGNGFFVVRDGLRSFYTRDGAFGVSSTGELVNPTNGFKVQGWNADAVGTIDTSLPIASILIPFGQPVNAQETTAATFRGNLDSRLATGATVATVATTIDLFDSLGAPHPVTVTFTKAAAVNTWDVTVTSTDPDVTGIVPAPASLVFKRDRRDPHAGPDDDASDAPGAHGDARGRCKHEHAVHDERQRHWGDAVCRGGPDRDDVSTTDRPPALW